MKSLTISLLLLFSYTLAAQVNNINDDDMSNLTKLGNSSAIRVPKKSSERLSGSPFLEKKWHVAKAKLKNVGDVEIIIKYDIYKDQVMYYRDIQRDSIIITPGQIQEFTFKYLSYQTFRYLIDKQQPKRSGIYEIYYEGKLSLVKKWSVDLYKESEQKTYTSSNGSPGFIRKERWFVYKAETFQKIKLNKNYFFKLFPNYQEKMKVYANQEKIDFKSSDGWIKLLKYYESR